MAHSIPPYRLNIWLGVLALCLPWAAQSYTYNLSICMIFRDEAPYLKEWIEFHRLLGVEHFYLYNNLSQDNYREVLQPYVEAGWVELIEWDRESSNSAEWNAIQIGAYNDRLARSAHETKWLAILDSDEFLFPTHQNDLSTFLKNYENIPGIGGLLVSWVVFGTSRVARIPEDKLLIETLVYADAQGSDHFKTIFLTDRVLYVCSPHYALYKEGYRHCTPSGGWPPFIEIDQIRINHYWSRDEWYLNQIKIPRRLVRGTDAATCRHWASASNRSYDTAILRFVEPLRVRMQTPR